MTRVGRRGSTLRVIVGGGSGWALVNSAFSENTSGAANGAVTLPSVTAGQLIVIAAKIDKDVVDVTIPTGFTAHKALDDSGTTMSIYILSKVAAGGETTLTFTHTSAIYSIAGAVFSGNHATPFDTSVSQDLGTVNTIQPHSGTGITPAVTNELMVAATAQGGGNGGSEAVGSGFTVLGAASLSRLVVGYKFKTDATAENPTLSWTTAREAIAAMAAWKPV